MATCRYLPEMKLDLKNFKEDVYQLLAIIKPSWKRDQIKVKALSGGYSCSMFRCSHDDGESVTVRGRGCLEGVRDPKLELQVVKELSSKGYFPPVLAVFQNGFCYEYIPGKPLLTPESAEVSTDEEQLRLIARQMADIHSTKLPEFDYSKTGYYDFVAEMLATSDPCCEGCPSMAELKEEVRFVQELVSSVGSPLVLIHGDAHLANIVWNEERRQITFVDYELSQVAPRACDIAYFFDSFASCGFYGNIPSSPPSDFKEQFCIPYLQRWNELHNKPTPTEEEIQQLLVEIKYYLLVVRLLLAVCTVKFPEVNSTFGSIERIWEHNFGSYLSAKEKLTGTKALGKPDKTDDKS